MPELPLASEFPPASREDWLGLVDKVLKGAPFERLRSKTYDSLTIEPIYRRAADAKPIAGRGAGAPWQILQRVDHPDPAAANAEALHDLENGASGLSLVFAGSVGAYGYGLDGSAAAIARALDGVHLDAGISVELDLSPQTKDVGARLAALVKQRVITPAATTIRFGFDPIGAMAVAGGSPLAWGELAQVFNSAVQEVSSQGFKGPFAAADGRVIHNAGGSEAQELAFALAAAVAYLRALEAAGIPLDVARGMIFFRLAADSDQFLTMAKFRALRKLWARLEEASGLAPEPVFISAETAWRMTTRRDPQVNMLRAAMAVVAAGLGGADAISVLPFTAALGLPDRFARRVARNTQLILLDESNLAKVADPAAGSGGIEDLTAKLCASAWSLFQEIERAGGAAAALEQNLIQKQVAAVRAEREQALKDGREALTGATIFPNPDEVPAAVLNASAVVLPTLPKTVSFDPLAPRRLAEPFE
ncbi:MAG: methylmalonyl-CoA mutase subunit beta [Bradyrhizobiaceae bacterium]|nr:methylmalonyl-CoA mutase subunit beta [Bradyrhizobiaceae bacterium]